MAWPVLYPDAMVAQLDGLYAFPTLTPVARPVTPAPLAPLPALPAKKTAKGEPASGEPTIVPGRAATVGAVEGDGFSKQPAPSVALAPAPVPIPTAQPALRPSDLTALMNKPKDALATRLSTRVALGNGGVPAHATFDAPLHIKDAGSLTDRQKAFDAITAPKKNAWLTTSGTIRLGGPAKSGKHEFVDAGLTFSQTRPYAYDPRGPNVAQLASKLASNPLPLSAGAARKLEQGSTFSLNGHLSAGVEQKSYAAHVGRTAKLDVERLEGSKVRATLALADDDAISGVTAPIAAGKNGLQIKGGASRTQAKSIGVELDLDTVAGRESFERLLRFDAAGVQKGKDGVTVTSDTLAQNTKVEGSLSGKTTIGPVSASGDIAASLETRVDPATGDRSEIGMLTGKANLSSAIGDTKIGFDANKDRSYTFTVPAKAEGSFALPLDAKSADALPEGAAFALQGAGKMKLAAAEKTNTGEIKSADSMNLKVTKSGPHAVTVSASLHDEKNGAATIHAGSADLGGNASHARDRVLDGLKLDLTNDAHRQAYDALLTGDASGAMEIGRQQGVATEKTKDADKAHAAVKVGDVSGALDRASTVEDDGKIRKESGSTAADLTVTSKHLGFHPQQQKSFTLTTPSAATTPELPLDADTARALAKGSTFVMSGQGTVGATLDTKDLKAGTSRVGAMDLKVERGEGDLVKASLKLTETSDDSATVTPKFGKSISMNGTHTLHTKKVQDVSVSLDLSKDADRSAYDAMVRGDVGPAAKLAEQRGQPAVTKNEYKSDDEIDATFNPLAGLTIGAGANTTVVDAGGLDPLKQATSADLAKEGKDARWTRVDAHLDPSFGASKAGTFGSTGTFGFGVKADAKVSYDAVAPTTRGDGALQPPTRANDIIAQAPGSQYHFHGAANLTAEANAAITGGSMPVPGVTIAAKAELSAKHVRVEDLDVKVSRLAGKEVQVEMAAKHVNETSTAAGLTVGLTVDPTGLLAKAGPIASISQVRGKVGANIRVEARTEEKHDRKRALDLRFDFAKATPEMNRAYEEAVRGRPELALEMSDRTRKGQDSGVRIKSGTDSRIDSSSSESSVALGGNKIYLQTALRSDTTEITEDETSRKQTDTSLMKRSDKQIYGDRREMRFQAVNVATTEDPKGKRFYQISAKKHDALTSRTDVTEMERMGQILGMTEKAPTVKKAAGGLESALGKAYGTTDTEVEVFFTEKGIDNVRHATKEQAIGAYAATAQARNGDKSPAPWASPADRKEADDFYARYKDAKTKDAFSFDMNDMSKNERRVKSDYSIRFGRDIERDRQDRGKAEAFASMVTKMGSSEDPVVWNKAFADFGKKVGFDSFGALGAWNKLAGADEVLVNKLSMKGSRVSIDLRE